MARPAKQETTNPEVNVLEIRSSNEESPTSKVTTLLKSENSAQSVDLTTSQGPTERGHKSGGGPRTKLGKLRSSRNSIKHGIYSQALLLPGESQAELDSLHAGLRKDFAPEGTFEDALVERLAVIMWRQRRVLIAENAEIRKGREFLESDAKQVTDEMAFRILDFEAGSRGLMRRIANPKVLQECLDLLKTLEARIGVRGLDVNDDDRSILEKIYGDHRLDLKQTTLQTKCIYCLAQAKLSPEECKDVFLHYLNEEVSGLKRLLKKETLLEVSKMKVESLRASVPEGPQLDRLIRCEANLGREFQRTLNQLERAQRMRRGQPVPAPVSLDVSV